MGELKTWVNWLDAAGELQCAGEDYVLVTVLGVRGSTPRDNGAKMVIARTDSYGSIGGGHLEYRAHQIAAEMLAQKSDAQRLEHVVLGPSLGQCCGGRTSLLFESFLATQWNLMLFGAGHVGAALAPILAQLPVRLRWVDSREKFLQHALPATVEAIYSDEPASEVAAMPAHSGYVIMTHNHQQDYEILQAVLARGDAGYVGLIGSKTKWRRFQLRMRHQGKPEEFSAGVRCPVGLAGVPGKLPMEIAVSIAAELIGFQHARDRERTTLRGLTEASLEPVQAS